MKLTAKYIIIKKDNLLTPIIFSCTIQHKDMASNWDVISAGFVDILCYSDIIVKTYG